MTQQQYYCGKCDRYSLTTMCVSCNGPTLTPIQVSDGKDGYRTERSDEIRERWKKVYGK